MEDAVRHSNLSHLLIRAGRIRQRLEIERSRPGVQPSILLRLQLLLLRIEQRLAETMGVLSPQPVPVRAGRQSSNRTR